MILVLGIRNVSWMNLILKKQPNTSNIQIRRGEEEERIFISKKNEYVLYMYNGLIYKYILLLSTKKKTHDNMLTPTSCYNTIFTCIIIYISRTCIWISWAVYKIFTYTLIGIYTSARILASLHFSDPRNKQRFRYSIFDDRYL